MNQPNLQTIMLKLDDYYNAVYNAVPPKKDEMNKERAIDAIYAGLVDELELDTHEWQKKLLKRWCYGDDNANT